MASKQRGSVVWSKGSWIAQVSRGKDPLTGKRIRDVERADPCGLHEKPLEDCSGCREQAEELRTALLARFDAHRHVDPSQRTVGHFLAEWLETHRTQVRRRTISGYQLKIDKQINPHIGTIPLQKLDARTLNLLYERLLETYARGTVKAVHVVMRRSLRDAVTWNYLTHNPAQDARLPAEIDGEDSTDIDAPELRVWTSEQVRTFLTAALEQGHRDYAFWCLAVRTGMRRSEMLGLKWDKVDVDEGIIYVHRTLHWEEGDFFWSPPKSKSSRRKVHLSRSQVEALRAHKKAQTAERLAAGQGWQDNNLVFCSEDGTPDRPSNFSLRHKRLSDKLGLPRIGLHGLRHTFATLLIEAGVPLHEISKELGHANSAFTNDVYGHLTKHMGSRAADAIDDALGG